MDEIKKLSPDDEVLMYAMRDVSRTSSLSLVIIMIFELILLAIWVASSLMDSGSINIGYMACYGGLFLVSLVSLLLMIRLRSDIRKNFRVIYYIQNIYALLIFIWALAITELDAVTRDSFSIIVYMTIMTIVPVICYMNSNFWGFLYVISGVFMIVLAYFFEPGFTAFAINFSVLIIISMVAQATLYKIRKDYYQREFRLRQISEKESLSARVDALTGLKNRREYLETAEKYYGTKKNPDENLAVAFFDLNGLKKINDSYGHDAGDEFIIAAASMIKDAYGSYGTIFRMGGDEFEAILNISEEQYREATEKLSADAAKWRGRNGNSMSFAAGWCFLKDDPDMSFEQMEKAADIAMYENKRRR
ncbi:MAG: GGDEF domain-containing protein [Lachnospiraceae bacterium]